MSVTNYDDLRVHIGHSVEVVAYGKDGEDPVNIAIECNDCNEVLLDYELKNLRQCGSCEQCFDVGDMEDAGRCPYCLSGNWIEGYIDDPYIEEEE